MTTLRLKRGFLLAVFCAFPLLAFSSCKDTQPVRSAFTAMDTAITAKFYGAEAKQAAEHFQTQIEDLDGLWSKTDPQSDIARLNLYGTLPTGQLDLRTIALLEKSSQLSRETKNAFDPALGRLVSLWGIGTEKQQVPGEGERQAVLERCGNENLMITEDTVSLKNEIQLDLGGIAKGAATDEAVKVLEQFSLDGYLLSLGGNVYVHGEKPDQSEWRVGISDPDGKADYLGYLAVSDCAVVTSGDYERFFIQEGVRYHHILDRTTGAPSQSGLRSVTVVCKDAAKADAYSTALFVMGAEKGMSFCEKEDTLDAVFVTDDHQIFLTDGLKECFSLTESERYQVMSEGPA